MFGMNMIKLSWLLRDVLDEHDELSWGEAILFLINILVGFIMLQDQGVLLGLRSLN